MSMLSWGCILVACGVIAVLWSALIYMGELTMGTLSAIARVKLAEPTAEWVPALLCIGGILSFVVGIILLIIHVFQ